MNSDTFMGLVNNAALLLALAVLHETLPLKKRPTDRANEIVSGILLGFIGMAIMLTPWRFSAGVIFDTRSILLSLTGLFFGMIPTLIAAAMTCVLRIAQGGSGAFMGMGVLLTSATLGLVWRYLLRFRNKTPRWYSLYGFGVIVHAAMLLWILALPPQLRSDVFKNISLPVMLIYPLGTVLLGLLLIRQRQQNEWEQELRQERDLIAQISETSLDAILLTSTDGSIEAANPAACRMFGRTEEEIIRIGRSGIVDTTDPRLSLALEERARSGSFIGELTFIRKEGQKFPGEVSSASFKDKDGRERISMIIRDISARKQAEAQLLLQSTALNAVANAIIITDKNGGMEWCNPAFTELTGYAPEEAVGKNPRELVNSGKQDRSFYKGTWDTILAGNVWRGELINRRKDGSLYTEEQTITPLKNADGTIGHFIAIKQDVTKRKQAEEALRESTTKLETLIHVSPLAFLLLDKSGNVQMWNSSAERIFGWAAQEIIGCPNPIIPMEKQEEYNAWSEQVLQGNPIEQETIRQRKDGSLIHVSISSALVYDGARNVIGRMAIIADISARKQTEEALASSEAELRALFASMRDVVLVIDRQGLYRKIIAPTNPGLLIRPASELLGKNLRDVFPVEQAEIFIDTIGQVLNTNQTTQIEYELLIEDQTVYFETSISPMDQESTVWVARTITERKQSEDRLRVSSEQLRILYEASQKLNRTLDLDQIYNTVSDFMSTIAPNDGVFISSFAPSTQMITCRAYWTNNVWQDVSEFPSIPLEAEGKGTQSIAIRTGQSLLLNDYQAYVKTAQTSYYINDENNKVQTEVSPEEEVTRSALIVPLKIGGKVSGVIQVLSYNQNAYNENQLKLLESLALHIASAEQNALLFAQVQSELQERKRREDELQVMVTISAALRTASTRNEILPIILDQASALIGTPHVSLEFYDVVTDECLIEIARGDWSESQGTRLLLMESASRLIIASGQPFLCEDARTDPNMAKNFTVTRPLALVAVPLSANQKIIGVLWAGRYGDDTASQIFTTDEVRLLSAVADIAANAINRTTSYEEAQRVATDLTLAYDRTLEGWARALELRDQETEGHTRRVVKTTVDLAHALDFSEDELEHIRRGALLHDIGKMGIPDSILLKPGVLNEREWEIMHRHPEYAYDMLTPIEYLRPALDIPYCHHEKWDGTGYPRGLKGEEIPLAARIFAIVDVWDALTSDRPYRKAWAREKALDFIREQNGKHFDPKVFEAFLKLLDKSLQITD